MIKSELAQRVLAQNPHLFLRDAEKIVNVILEEIVAAMLKDNDLVGAFSITARRFVPLPRSRSN